MLSSMASKNDRRFYRSRHVEVQSAAMSLSSSTNMASLTRQRRESLSGDSPGDRRRSGVVAVAGRGGRNRLCFLARCHSTREASISDDWCASHNGFFGFQGRPQALGCRRVAGQSMPIQTLCPRRGSMFHSTGSRNSCPFGMELSDSCVELDKGLHFVISDLDGCGHTVFGSVLFSKTT
jgi:hypothetical protein